MSCNGPSSGHTSVSSDNNKANDSGEKKEGPSMIFLSSEPNAEFHNHIDQMKTGAVALTGSAAMGKIGPTVGLIDIAESDDTYFFRVALPGVSTDEKDFSCNIEPDGTVMIKGITTTGEETVYAHSQELKMLTQNVCPPGDFTISFQLLGPVIVGNDDFIINFGPDGVLKSVVKKLHSQDYSYGDGFV